MTERGDGRDVKVVSFDEVKQPDQGPLENGKVISAMTPDEPRPPAVGAPVPVFRPLPYRAATGALTPERVLSTRGGTIPATDRIITPNPS